MPVLELMRRKKDGFVTIGEIRDYIIENYSLSELDLKKSTTRPNECMFEQQIRNLRSHNKLQKMGLAENVENGFRLLPEIGNLLENSSDWLYDVIGTNINRSNIIGDIVSKIDKKRKIVGFDEISGEGVPFAVTSVKKRSRSVRLRNFAINFFKDDAGLICCDCCGFEFKSFYGEKYGKVCIEIHHIKPIFMYEDMDENKTMAEAIKNLMPVCPNCHRTIHQNKLFSINKISEFKDFMMRQNHKYHFNL